MKAVQLPDGMWIVVNDAGEPIDAGTFQTEAAANAWIRAELQREDERQQHEATPEPQRRMRP